MGIEPTQPAWKAGILAVELHPHLCSKYNTTKHLNSQVFCGYFLKKHQYNNKFFLIAFGIYFLALILCPSYIDMRTNNLVWGNYYWYYIVALAGIITINGLFFYLTKKEIPVLNILGKNSMAILCIHWLVLYCVKIIFPNLQGFSFLIVSALLVIIVMPIIILWIRHTKFRNFI